MPLSLIEKGFLKKYSSREWNSRAEFSFHFHRRAIESILTWNITNCHGSSWPRTGRLYSGWLKPTKTSQVPSTEHQWHQWSETSAQSPEDTNRQHPPRHSLFSSTFSCPAIEEKVSIANMEQLHSEDLQHSTIKTDHLFCVEWQMNEPWKTLHHYSKFDREINTSRETVRQVVNKPTLWAI